MTRRRAVAVTVTVLVLIAGGAAAAERTHLVGNRHDGKGNGSAANGSDIATATVLRRSLAARTSVGGTLGYAGSYTVLGQQPGTVTAVPSAGQVITQGHALYWVNGTPVVLLYGATPFYRSLAQGTTAAAVTGVDVQQLNRDLVALGYAGDLGLDPSSNEFSWATKAALMRMQKALGLEQTGKLTPGQVVFLPAAIRVVSVSATLGGPAAGPVLKATSLTRQVTVSLAAVLQSTVKVGDRVQITLPDGSTTPGRVSSVGKVATAGSGTDSSAKIEVTVTPLRPSATGTLDQAPVQVSITTAMLRDVLVVPVNALLALAGGGYAVEVVAADGAHRLQPVTTGLFDDSAGLVQVTGPGLVAGQHVVVPAS